MIKKLLFVSIFALPHFAQGSALSPSDSPLFSQENPLELFFKGEFDRVHKANAGGNWTGEERTDPQYWTDATLADKRDPSRIFKAKVRARGMSSADDSQFPKLRVEIDNAEEIKGTVFKGARNFRMNTHVVTHPVPNQKHTGAGRLADERSPYREALAYEVARAMGLAAPATRRARVEYTDTSPGVNESFTRNALIIETDKKIAERTGAKISETFPDTNKIPTRIGALFYVFNALIGNADLGLKLKEEPSMGTEIYRPYFNTTVFDFPSGEQFPIVYDFDYASFVADWDSRQWDDGDKIFGLEPHLESMVKDLVQLRSRLNKAEYQQAIADYKTSRKKILDVIAKGLVDEEGRNVARDHVATLDQGIAFVDQYPMLINQNVRFYADKAMEKDLVKRFEYSEKPGPLKPGVLVKVIKDEGNMVKVAVIDVRNDLKDVRKNVGYIQKKDLILGYDLPENLQGQVDERDMAGGGGE